MLLIDSREPSRHRTQIQAALGGEVCFLEAADYVLGDMHGCTLGIERKTWSDLLGTLAAGRLYKQFDKMRAVYNPCILLVEGSYKMTGDGFIILHGRKNPTGWRHAAVQAVLYGAQQSGIRVIQTIEIASTIDVIRWLKERGMKGCFDGRSRKEVLSAELQPSVA